MSALLSDYTGNTVLIYNKEGIHLASTVIDEHDKVAKQIHISDFPDGLNVNDECKILILSSPRPCEFNGKIRKIGKDPYIGLFQGQLKENRSVTRYPVTSPAIITMHIIKGKPHPLQNPITVKLINISTNGIRFRAPSYSFDIDDEFEMYFIINNIKKKITAKITNNMDTNNESVDYGSIFIAVE